MKTKTIMKFAKNRAAVLLCLSALLFSGCAYNEVTEEDFVLNVSYDEDIKACEPVEFHCEMIMPGRLKVGYGAHMISYKCDGKGEIVITPYNIEIFSKGQLIERTVSFNFDEKSEHQVTFFSDFGVADNNNEFVNYRIQKEITVDVK